MTRAEPLRCGHSRDLLRHFHHKIERRSFIQFQVRRKENAPLRQVFRLHFQLACVRLSHSYAHVRSEIVPPGQAPVVLELIYKTFHGEDLLVFRRVRAKNAR
jgi:hypothetical protein